ncbi:conserved hypothetical protein [Tenacibaculum maritimum]|uniref:hypothetical protein n=1 Tax=Tenacibaculum maritimum TaxID=107401 RepID=UPI0012E54BC1|nr:hypothetical protein [Tenacibaculum maritimum]CAA0177426.1 conserved hypothetical protein [Tenacibaculum maritimum]
MRIRQEKNGNITIVGVSGAIEHILPVAYIHKHPRYPNEAILITGDMDYKNEERGIAIVARQVTYINDKRFKGNVHTLKAQLEEEFVLKGNPKDTIPKTKETDPMYVAFLQANTYEKMLAFVKEHQDNIGGKKYYRDGRISEQEFFCQFETFIIRVTLRYYYKRGDNTLINYILMYGSTANVHEPRKVYVYDANNTITGYVYKKA